MSRTEINRLVQEAEEYRDADEANMAKIEATHCLKTYCVTVGDTATEKQLKFKFEAADEDEPNKEKIEVFEVAKVILQERVASAQWSRFSTCPLRRNTRWTSSSTILATGRSLDDSSAHEHTLSVNVAF